MMPRARANDTSPRQTCSPEHPMPAGDTGRWQHTNVIDDGECLGGCCDYFKCLDCGHRWREEVPE